MYRYDYIMCLFTHSFSWNLVILIPAMLFQRFCILAFILNFIIHAIIDQLKANALKINLTQDQCLHLLQIMITFI